MCICTCICKCIYIYKLVCIYLSMLYVYMNIHIFTSTTCPLFRFPSLLLFLPPHFSFAFLFVAAFPPLSVFLWSTSPPPGHHIHPHAHSHGISTRHASGPMLQMYRILLTHKNTCKHTRCMPPSHLHARTHAHTHTSVRARAHSHACTMYSGQMLLRRAHPHHYSNTLNSRDVTCPDM